MLPSFKKILKDDDMRRIYLDGFSNGYAHAVKQTPNHLQNIYELGYNDGQSKKVQKFFTACDVDSLNVKRDIPPTRS